MDRADEHTDETDETEVWVATNGTGGKTPKTYHTWGYCHALDDARIVGPIGMDHPRVEGKEPFQLCHGFDASTIGPTNPTRDALLDWIETNGSELPEQEDTDT